MCDQIKLIYNESLDELELIILSGRCGDPYKRSKHYLKKIIGHKPLGNAIPLKGVGPLESVIDEVEALAIEEVGIDGNIYNESDHLSFIKGYKKAMEKYKYTEEDMKKAIKDTLNNSYGRIFYT